MCKFELHWRLRTRSSRLLQTEQACCLCKNEAHTPLRYDRLNHQFGSANVVVRQFAVSAAPAATESFEVLSLGAGISQGLQAPRNLLATLKSGITTLLYSPFEFDGQRSSPCPKHLHGYATETTSACLRGEHAALLRPCIRVKRKALKHSSALPLVLKP